MRIGLQATTRQGNPSKKRKCDSAFANMRMFPFAHAQLCHVLLLTCVRKDYTTIVERARALADTPNTFLNVQGLGPTAALSRLRDNLPDNLAHRETFWAEAGTAAITGILRKPKTAYDQALT